MWKTAIAACLALLPRAALADEALFSHDGYRITHYRGPIPYPPEGVQRISAEDVARLRPDIDAVLIDVLPAEGGHRDANGQWHLATPHSSIPGAHWFPETGRGVLAPDMEHWLERGMRRLTGGAKSRVIVTFCLADCWMSWNAARRLRAMGYTSVRWFAEGMDGWSDLSRPLTKAMPEPDRTKGQL